MKKTLALIIISQMTVYAGQPESKERTPVDSLPAHISQITQFGQRADWSHGGERILFVEKTFGDVYEIELATGQIRPLTHHYYHEGYTRALYLSTGDILLSGSQGFNSGDPLASRFKTAELWVLSKELNQPPTRLGEYCWEGPAVSRTQLRIAWSANHDHRDLPDGTWQLWTGEIDYREGVPQLINKRMVLDNRNLDHPSVLEPQNFRPPEEKELIVQISSWGELGTEVMGLDLESGSLTNYSQFSSYDEPEGIFPHGTHTLVESNNHIPEDNRGIDIYRLALDGSRRMERLTFFTEQGAYKATNPVVSDDGRYMAFQFARRGDMAGIGRGLLLFDFDAYERRRSQ